MFFYIFLFIFVSLFSFCYSKTKNLSVAVISKSSVFLLLFIPAAIRYGIGTDYYSYVSIFNSVSSGMESSVEIGATALIKVLAFFNCSAQSFFVLWSLLTLFFLFSATPKKSFYIIIPLYFVLQYGFSYNGVRQALSISIAYLAYQKNNDKKKIQAVLYVLIACLFHKSAILYFVLFVCLFLLKIKKIHAILFFFFILCLDQFALQIIDFFFTTFSANNIVRAYASNSNYNKLVEVNTGMGVLWRYSIYFLFLLFIPKTSDKRASNAYLALLALIFCDMLAINIKIFSRVQVSFVFAWFPIIHLFNLYKIRYRKLILPIFYLWALYGFISMLLEGTHEITPYSTIFS